MVLFTCVGYIALSIDEYGYRKKKHWLLPGSEVYIQMWFELGDVTSILRCALVPPSVVTSHNKRRRCDIIDLPLMPQYEKRPLVISNFQPAGNNINQSIWDHHRKTMDMKHTPWTSPGIGASELDTPMRINGFNDFNITTYNNLKLVLFHPMN